MIYEVFRQERKGQPFPHAGSLEAPNPRSPTVRARGVLRPARRVGRAVGRAARGDPRDRDFVDELKRNYHRVDGYPLKEKLKEARERAGTLEELTSLLELADDELILGWRDSEWTGIAPFLEEDVAFSSIAQNEIGHARALYELAAASSARRPTSSRSTASPRSTAARRSSSCAAPSGRGRSRGTTSTRPRTPCGSRR